MVSAPTRAQMLAMARHHPTAWALYASGWGEEVDEHGNPLPGSWQNAAHFDFLADCVMRLRTGDTRRVCVSLPPGHGKSEFLSLYTASWWLGTRPKSRVVIASYGKSLALGWSERAKDILHELGPEVFGVTVNRSQSSELWYPRDMSGRPLGGYYYPVGRGGALTGKRSDILVIDDLIKDDVEARSEATRDSAWAWFDKVAMTRLMPDSRVIMIATRWHEDDPIGRLEQRNANGEVDYPWEFVNLPAIAVGDSDPLGRQPGEALWPEMWPADELRRKEAGHDPATWASLFQGRPTGGAGGIFRREWLTYYVEEGVELVGPGSRVRRENLAVFATLDLAYSTKTSADYTVCCVWGADLAQGVLYLMHVERERVGAEELAHWIRRVFASHGVRRGFVERSGFYADITRYLTTAARLPLREIQPNTDKLSRAQPAAALMASGGLLLRTGAPWVGPLVDELMAFDKGLHDDQVDALSFGVHVYNQMRQGRPGRGRDGGNMLRDRR